MFCYKIKTLVCEIFKNTLKVTESFIYISSLYRKENNFRDVCCQAVRPYREKSYSNNKQASHIICSITYYSEK